MALSNNGGSDGTVEAFEKLKEALEAKNGKFHGGDPIELGELI